MLFCSLFFLKYLSELIQSYLPCSAQHQVKHNHSDTAHCGGAELPQTQPPLLNRRRKVLWETASSTILNTASSNNNLKYNSKCKKHALGSIQTDTTLLFSRDFLEPAWPQKAQSSREGSQRHSSREIPSGYAGVGLHLNKPGFVQFTAVCSS